MLLTSRPVLLLGLYGNERPRKTIRVMEASSLESEQLVRKSTLWSKKKQSMVT